VFVQGGIGSGKKSAMNTDPWKSAPFLVVDPKAMPANDALPSETDSNETPNIEAQGGES
jgi:hypothetical protein